MLVIKNDTKVIKSGGVFALGNFDGVHLGHKEIIDITKDISIKNSSYAGVIVFEPHPRKFFNKDSEDFYLSDLKTKEHLLEMLGMECFVVLDFNKEMSERTPVEFIKEIIIEKINTKIDKKKNKIITKPIAGTLKKRKKINKIKALNFFRNNEKETKEHNMIVDMERSDLSKICKPGSVKILKKKYVEEYKHLFHYVTSIQGMLKKNITPKSIIKAMMPGGSVIGCPKIRTLELLNNQEKEERNIFTGSFGYIKFNKDGKKIRVNKKTGAEI